MLKLSGIKNFKNITNKNNYYIKLLFFISILILYFLGFYLRENIAGGAELDFKKFTWPAIESFKKDFSNTLINYGKIGEGSLPLFHIINAYLNPFTYNQFIFQFSITVISILNVYIFSQILKLKLKISQIDSMLYSSIFLILPFFRSSAFWGLTENFGWLFLLIAIKFFVKMEKDNFKNHHKNILFICIFSSLALYTRPYLIFFPIFLSLYFIFSKKLNHLKISSLYYLIFSVPGFTLLYLWGGSLFMGEGFEKTNFIYEFHHPRFVLKNLIFFASIFYFYLLPFKIIEKIYLLKKNKNLIDFKTLMIFMIFFLFLFFLYYFNFLEFLTMTKLGGGFFLKLNNLIFEKNYIIFILFSSFGFVYIFEYMQMNKRNIILFLSLLIYCFPKFIFQEYFEPLVLILFFTLIELKKSQIQALKNSSSFVIVFTYFLIFLFTSFYYRYFIF